MKQDLLTQIVHQLSFAGKNRSRIFLELSKETRAYVFLNLSRRIQLDLISSLQDEILIDIFNYFDPDDITDIIQLLPEKRQKKIIEKFNESLKDTVEILNQFDPKSAAGLMNIDYIQVQGDSTISEVAKRFKIHEKRTGRLPVIFIVEENGIQGFLPGHELGFAKPTDKVQKYVRKISVIKHNATHDEVIRLFKMHPHNKVAVVGPSNNVIGVIYSDDVLKVIQEGNSTLYDFAGVADEESVSDSVKEKVKHRYKWLIANLATAFLASFTVSLFDETISRFVLLAVYMPIVAGMGGNAGTQTLAILIRGITLNQIELKNAWPTLKREVLAGVINGAINGILVASIVILFNRDLKLAFVLSMAMIINLFVAAFFGTLVPLFMKKIGKDPATSATIFITTATDVLGFLAFLGLATIILL